LSEPPTDAGALVVRQACPADVGELVALYQEARAELSTMRGGRVLLGLGERGRGEDDVASTFLRQLSEQRWRVVVGGPGGGAGSAAVSSLSAGAAEESLAGSPAASSLAGYGTCTVLELGGGELLGSIEELYVRPEARRSGLGRALASLLVGWCLDRGCSGVDAKALPGSRAVKSFFEGEGFTARLLVMHRRLS
jgi:GNAT superfamily N-acetyltransferase